MNCRKMLAFFFWTRCITMAKVSQSDSDKKKKIKRVPKPHWKPSRMEPKPLNILWKN